ncbi:hypothetical protein JRQ81_011430 [Phrynocephalus forsythii]|uniref:Galectin n=1 Tax=Phrynocephalus forsythii TaxID=171643 RepID=A0A9Q0X6R5_9SAUR|nr:hypothetical protein JRQ81_011430 [Phrynocephalus forsythii]
MAPGQTGPSNLGCPLSQPWVATLSSIKGDRRPGEPRSAWQQKGSAKMALIFDTLEIPYYRGSPWGLDSESWVMVEGFILQHSQGFHLDLAYGQFHGASIPLRFKLIFEGGPSSPATASLNSCTDGRWGDESKIQTHLRQGQRFKVQVIVTSKGYKILENDTFLVEFGHRLSPKKIRFFEMHGDIRLQNVAFSRENRTLAVPTYSAGQQAC